MNPGVRDTLAAAVQIARDALGNALHPRPRRAHILSAGEDVPAWVYAATDPGPGVAFFHTALGVTPHEHAIGRRLAAAGVTTLLTRYSRRTSGRLLGNADERARLERIARDALEHLRSLPGVTPTRVGTLGQSLGGYLAISAATAATPPLAAAVVHYGLYPEARALVEALETPLLVLQGERDAAQFVDEARRASARRTPGREVVFYQSARHQFDLVQAFSADASDAWARTIAFLRAHL